MAASARVGNVLVIQEIEVAEVASRLQRGESPVLLDVRDPDEHAAGCMAGALLLPRPLVAHSISALVPDKDTPLVVYCAVGIRSAMTAMTLTGMGYTQVWSMRGGFDEWQRSGLAWIVPPLDGVPVPLSAEQAMRYSRHLRLPEIGMAGQAKLLAARVLCIGAGGLGSPASLYLAAAGIGTLGLVDADSVELSNLQRQIVHATARIGMPKVDSAAETLAALNPEVCVTRIQARLTDENVLAILAGYDVIIDGSDNFTTRYLVNDAALRLKKPVVHAAIQGFEGQLTVFAAEGAPCYRCVFPEPPPAEFAPSCQQAGVLGVLPGILGILQATEALKLILGIGETLAGRLLSYDALSMRFTELSLRYDPECSACGSSGPGKSEAPGWGLRNGRRLKA